MRLMGIGLATALVGASLAAPAAAASTTPTTAPATMSTSAAPAGDSIDWVADLEFLDAQVRAVHPDPWGKTPEADWAARVAELKQTLPAMSPDEAKIALTALVALLDTHSGIFPEEIGFHYYPFLPYLFDDGMYVLHALDEALVGARIVSVAGMPMADVIEAIRPLVPADNESAFKDLVTYSALIPEYLQARGVVSDLDAPAFELELRDGTTTTVNPAPTTVDAFFSSQLAPTEPDGPIAFTRRNEAIWWETLADDKVFYIGYNDAGVEAGEAIAAMSVALDSGAADRVILDARYARGGSSNATGPLRSALTDDPRINREGGLIVLIGREDVSASTAMISQLEQDTQAVFVGEPTPARPNTLLDEQAIPLPSSGIPLHIPAKIVMIAGEGDTRVAVEPDIPVGLLSTDFFARRDATLEAALKLE